MTLPQTQSPALVLMSLPLPAMADIRYYSTENAGCEEGAGWFQGLPAGGVYVGVSQIGVAVGE